jgi:two-component system response regulator HydG
MPNPSTTVIVVSEDAPVIESCRRAAGSVADSRLIVVRRAHEAECFLAQDQLQLILYHLAHPEETSELVRLLRRLASLGRGVALLVIGERYDEEQAWGLKRLGAAEFLSQPLDLERLASLISLFSAQSGFGEDDCLPPRGAESALWQRPPGLSYKGMEALLEQVRLVAVQDMTVLLGGETGTGKTRLARWIHELSPRRSEPFLAINCGALAAELIESEMFGHVKGAFTGADRARAGKFAAAGRGTLLLDEIDALPLGLQAKLLRAVEERVFEPVGSNETVPVQARLIAASNRPLEAEVEAGRFRADLYYRLNVIGFHLPPLRERRGMIRHLAASFLADCADRNGRPVHGITHEALRVLESYPWPGNIRELRNVIERAVALCPGPNIGLKDLPEALCSTAASAFLCPHQAEPIDGSPAPLALRHARGEAEAALILQALRKHGNNRLRAARELGISRRTLYKKLHRYGLMHQSHTHIGGHSPNPRLLERWTNTGKAV